MATTVEKTPEGIIYKAAKTYPVPNVDILTLLFDRPYSSTKPSKKIHICAANPSHSLIFSAAKNLLKSTAFALRKHFSIGAAGPGGDVVSVISTGHHLLPLLVYGTWACGGVFSAANAASTASELSKQIQEADSKVLCCVEATRAVAVNAAELAGWGEGGGGRVLVMGEGEKWWLRAVSPDGALEEELVDVGQKLEWERITDAKVLEVSLAVLIYSSGTTGLPKGVRLSHSNLVAEAVLPGDMFKAHITMHRPQFAFRTLAHLPTAHIAGIVGYFINPLYMSGSVYWMLRFDFPLFLAYNLKYRITFFFTVPPIFLLIAKSPLVTTHFDSLEIAISGAAPLGKDLQAAASKKLGKGNTWVSQLWGLSETTGYATITFDIRDETGSVSPLIPNMHARIVDENSSDVEPGQPGEIWLRGPIVSKGYHLNSAANAASFVDGWFCTGDIAVFRDGLFYIVDRKKELIKYKGLQVAPAELEAVLLSHPEILDAAVIGVKWGEGAGEAPRAYVVADRNRITAEQVKEWVRQNVAWHKHLRGGVVFVQLIPKNSTGKILRKELRVLAKREMGPRL
ncbi:4-coumarate-CoA ligase-like protein [Lepidopterella palustris CBS 459.81]|uniref:4-coumarate-CoA ligase-like protein n=1 Tax=Lepidopterella palustris CBS 459.81 TaxID=1314670 RepID=A0A8E2E426_9PEZI|nr:4-coumarate-CoA ligase-like protein [Lepidopterella palustris CBS 459.81]